VSQDYFNDPRLGCKTPFNFVEFIKIDKIIEEQLEEFEAEFKREEIIEMNFLYWIKYIFCIFHFFSYIYIYINVLQKWKNQFFW